MTTPYDEIAPDYVAFVDEALEDAGHILNLAGEHLCVALGSVEGLRLCDLGCGEGHLSRRLAREGAMVAGVDSSQLLLEAAELRSKGLPIRYVLEDAQSLQTLRTGECDRVMSNFALMDIADLEAVYAAVHRVLRPGGRFLFSVTHPCFQLPRIAEDGTETAEESYFHERFWRSEWKGGIRGRVGAYHRTLSGYINPLIQAGFLLQALVEPRSPAQAIPKILIVACDRQSSRE